MELPQTQAQILSFLGVSNLAGVSAPKRFGYNYTIEFDEHIAAGGQSIKQVQVDTDGFFVVLAKTLAIYNPATTGGAVAFTPPALEASPTIGSNTWPTLASFMVKLQTQSQIWSSNAVNALAEFGTGASPAWEIVPRVIPPGQNVQATLINNSGITVKGQIVFYGYRLLK